MYCSLNQYLVTFLSSSDQYWLEIILFKISIAAPALFQVPLAWNIFSILWFLMFLNQMYFLYTTCGRVLFLEPFSLFVYFHWGTETVYTENYYWELLTNSCCCIVFLVAYFFIFPILLSPSNVFIYFDILALLNSLPFFRISLRIYCNPVDVSFLRCSLSWT